MAHDLTKLELRRAGFAAGCRIAARIFSQARFRPEAAPFHDFARIAARSGLSVRLGLYPGTRGDDGDPLDAMVRWGSARMTKAFIDRNSAWTS
jgi:hypothetical protein